MTDLWPDDLKTIINVKAPVNILREQASLLGSKTQNIVKAKVRQIDPGTARDETFTSWPIGKGHQKFHYVFNLVAPMLENYEYRLFMISHDVTLYPVYIIADDDILKELSVDKAISVNSEDELLEVLRKIFRAEKTKKIIDALVVQSVTTQ